MPVLEDLRKLKRVVPQSALIEDSYVSNVISRTQDAYAERDWGSLEKEGFHKKDDYCFIYSYPPVRTLKPITEDALFERTEYGNIDGPANLYLHIPYCTGICSYCYFAKVLDNDRAPVLREDYPEYISRELDLFLKRGDRPVVQSVHFGGGTPSTLNNSELTSIVKTIRQLEMVPDIEMTLECAPETIIADPSKVEMMLEAGINRFNIGVESLDNDVLRIMGRRHGSDETLRAMEIMLEHGVTNLNVDVIYDLPGQNLASWVDTLNRLEKFGVHSVSTYRLRKHPNKKISNLHSDLYPSYKEGLMMQLAHEIVMSDAGFVRSSSHKYARGENKLQRQVELKRSVGSDQLLSLGCGAYGFVNDTFYWNTKSLNEYGESIRNDTLPVWMGQKLSKEELMRKSMVLGMHTNAGVSIEDFRNRFAVEPQDVFSDTINNLVNLGLMEFHNGFVRPSEAGRFFSDELSLCFYSDVIVEELQGLDMRYGMFFEFDKYA